MEPKLTNTKGIKTYLNARYKCSKSSYSVNSNEDQSEPLTTKDAVRFLLQGTLKWRVCRFCLSTTTGLSELDEILEVASAGALYQVTIRDMIATFYPYQMVDDANFPNKICSKCLDRTLNSYLFAQQCERAERALRNCFNDINEKFDKLDPIERVKRRGRQKLNPNHNVLHSDYKKVMSYADPLINIVSVAASLEEDPEDMEINELECPKCWQILPNIESFVNHEKIHPKTMWFNCRLCGLSFVKHTQYKKHIKQCRKALPAPSIKKKEFKCSDCGIITDNFGKHLQHVEKHKFKNILEHLIERRMDDLCGVCLDQGEKMVELNETFHLHAGYPELTGEKTLAKVLRESLPENGYKYEDYVAKKPNILKVTRRCLDTYNIIPKSEELSWKSDIIHAPVNILEVYKKIAKKFLKSNVPYEFPKPYIFPDNSGLVNEFSLKNFNAFINPMNKEINVSYIKEHWIYPNDKVKETPRIHCKICWIFQEAQCESCIKRTSLTNAIKKSSVLNRKTPNCNMCWIFAKVGKCNFCQATVKLSDSKSGKLLLRKTSEKRKRQLNKEPEMIESKLKWQQRNKSLTNHYQTKMNSVNNYIGTKICEKCLNHALTCYIFLTKIRYNRSRLDTCISLMLENLENVNSEKNVMVEIAEDSILPLVQDEVENIELDLNNEIDESKLKVEVLEDEFRIESESSDESSVKSYSSFESIKAFDDLKKTLYPINPPQELILPNPAKDVRRTYVNKKLVNGLQQTPVKPEVEKPPPVDICSEFLTFKKKPKPVRRRVPRFTCPLCSKHFISDYFLKKHVLKHLHAKIKCTVCNLQVKSQFKLFEHMKMEHIASDVTYTVCTICERSFSDASKLKAHIKAHYSRECMLCGKWYANQKRFDSHLQRHAVKFNVLKNRKAQTCSFCEKECSNENELSLHVNKSHLQIKPYNCDMCEKQFYTEYNLSSHKLVHTLPSKETCEFCEKLFKCRGDLVVHVRRHIGSKPHHCYVCRQSFYSEGGRNCHMKKFHGGRLCCRLCKTMFNRKMDLKAHVNVAHNAM